MFFLGKHDTLGDFFCESWVCIQLGWGIKLGLGLGLRVGHPARTFHQSTQQWCKTPPNLNKKMAVMNHCAAPRGGGGLKPRGLCSLGREGPHSQAHPDGGYFADMKDNQTQYLPLQLSSGQRHHL